MRVIERDIGVVVIMRERRDEIWEEIKRKK
jgi:hypothetical protein